METIQMTTLQAGNGYDIPGLGSTVVVDYEIWTSHDDRPEHNYKGEL
jgi:hypothetical protein